MADHHGQWLWYELMTTDAEGAKAFYEPVVGWTITTSHGGDLNYGFIANPDGSMTGGLLPLTAEMQAGGAHPAWAGYIGVDDIDAAIPAAQALGAKLLMPKTTIDVGSFAMVADPAGAPYYLMQPTMSEGQGEPSTSFSPDTPGRCAWNELASADQAKALDYYPALYGWDLPEPMDMGAFGKYQFVSSDGVMTGAIMQKPAEIPFGGWSFYFRVTDIDTAHDTIIAHGGKVIMGPHAIPTGEWIIHGLDPQGAAFALVGKKKD